MCGILTCCVDVNNNFSLEKFRANLHASNFRGPDFSDVREINSHNNRILFGHNRLSIIDISETGNQPMTSSSGRLTISFNGEIYNHLELRKLYLPHHHFRGTSDTETLLELVESMGLDTAIELIQGMYAFVIYDQQLHEISISRDIPGEKPLYIMTSKESISFSSDISNFINLPGFSSDINYDAIKYLLSYTYIPSPLSIFSGIFKMPSAKILKVKLNNFKFKKFDTYKSLISDVAVTEDEYFSIYDLHHTKTKFEEFDLNLNQLESSLSRAVNKQLISDVPLGAFLSGGVDSSLIVALAKEHVQKLKTFNIGFEFLDFDESNYAKKVAGILGTDHTSHVCTKEDAINFIKKIPIAYSEPFADSSQIPTMLVSEIASRDVKVVLTGDSGDELFGGYNRYAFTNHYWKYLKLLPPWLKQFISNAIRQLPSSVVENFLFRILSIKVSGNIEDRINQFSDKLKVSSNEEEFYRSFLGGWSFGEPFISKDLMHHDSVSLKDDFVRLKEFNFIDKMMIFDFKTYMSDDILCKVDRGSMFSSLETRVPFLDKEVINISAMTPVHHKINGLENKIILKRLLSKYLPDDLINRPKMGFGIPVQEWIKTDLNEWAEYLLSEEQNKKHNIFDFDQINSAWLSHKEGELNNIMKLWPIIQFNQWYNHYIGN